MKVKKIFCLNCLSFLNVNLFYVKKNSLYCSKCDTIVPVLTVENGTKKLRRKRKREMNKK